MAAETGHVAGRAYFGQDGIFHLNGASIADANELSTDLTTTTGTDNASNGLQRKGLCRVVYDFAVDGGAQGAIIPATAVALPSKAVITDAWAHVLTAFQGGSGATLAISIEAANDLRIGAILATGGFSSTGFKALIPTGATTTFVQTTTATRKLTVTVGVADLTAGKAVIFLEYAVSA